MGAGLVMCASLVMGPCLVIVYTARKVGGQAGGGGGLDGHDQEHLTASTISTAIITGQLLFSVLFVCYWCYFCTDVELFVLLVVLLVLVLCQPSRTENNNDIIIIT